MSEKPEKVIEQLKAHQQIKTPEQLAAKKREMIEVIQNASSSELQKEAITRVACYSIDDAIEVAQVLNLKDNLGFLLGESEYVMHRHPRFFDALYNRLVSLMSNCSDVEISEQLFQSAHSIKILSEPGDRIQVDIDSGIQKIIDDYYSVLISKRKGFRVTAPESNSGLTEVQQKAMDFMQTTHEIMEPHVPVSTVTGFLRNIIAEDTGEEDPRAIDPWNDRDVEFVTSSYIKNEGLNPYGARISTDSAGNIINYVVGQKKNLKRSKEEIVSGWKKIAKKSRYQPLDVVYNLRKEKIEKDLKSELVEQFRVLGYDAEIFFDHEKQETFVKVKALSNESDPAWSVNWNKPPKKELWNLVKKDDVVEYKTEGPEGEVIMLKYKDKRDTIQACASQSNREVMPGDPIMAFDLENNKLYSKETGNPAVTARSLSGGDGSIEELFYIKDGDETVKEMSVVKGKLLCLVEMKGGGEILYVDGKVVDRSTGSEKIILDKVFDVNGELAYGLKIGNNLQKVRVNGRTYFTQEFDISPKGIVDIVPIEDSDFLAVGYLNKRPIAYANQCRHELDAMQQSDSDNGIRSVSVSKNKNGFTVVADYSDGEYIPFDKTEKRQGIRGLVDKKEFKGVSLTAKSFANKTEITFSNHDGHVAEFYFDNPYFVYHSVNMVNGKLLLTVKKSSNTTREAYVIVPVPDLEHVNRCKLSLDGPFFSTSCPQVLDQQDRVVVVTTENGVVCTHEWKKESPEPLIQPNEEVVLGVDDLDKVINGDKGAARGNMKLLNALTTGNMSEMEQLIKDYKEYRVEIGKVPDHKSFLAHSASFIKSLNRMVGTDPELFLDTLAARVDRTDEAYIDSVIKLVVPEYKEEEKARENGIIKSINKLIKALGFNRSSPKDYFGVHSERDMLGGDPSDGNKERLFAVKGDETGGVYLTSRYFGFDNKSGNFTQLSLPIDNAPTGATTEMTGEILLGPHIGNTTLLPQRMGAAIISERVKIVYKDGREEKVAVEQSKDGQYFVRIKYDKKMKSLVWSQEVPDAPYIPSDILGSDYEKTVKNIIPKDKIDRENFKRSFEDPIVALPVEEMFFVQSIKDLSPKEKLYAIEAYVHSVCYYDWDNGEVKDKKEGLKPQEQLSFMQVRCKELAEKNKILASSGKRYTGVCADFGVLTTALMRSAGLMAGVGIGAVLRGGVATAAQAHAVSVTPWPEGSSLRLTYIDGTPSEGLTEEETQKLAAVRFPTLKEREKTIEEVEEKYKADSVRMIKELEQSLEAGEDFAIEKLQNGELEKMLNVVLKYEVKAEHSRVIEGILNAVRYSGLPVFSEKIEDQIAVKRFLEAEIKRERGINVQMSPDSDSGTQLFDISREYVGQDGIDNLDKVIKLVDPYLHKTERRALMLLVKYLKAEKMKR